jgi:hypothetical protein
LNFIEWRCQTLYLDEEEVKHLLVTKILKQFLINAITTKYSIKRILLLVVVVVVVEEEEEEKKGLAL